MNRQQYNRTKKAFMFLTRPENREKYGIQYNHDSFNTCAFGMVFHAKLIKSAYVYYSTNDTSFGSPIGFSENCQEVIVELFGSALYRNVFSGDSGISRHDVGLPQFVVMLTKFRATLNEYEEDNNLPITGVPASAPASAPAPVNNAAKGLGNLQALHKALSDLSTINRERYGVTNEMLTAIENDVTFLGQYK